MAVRPWTLLDTTQIPGEQGELRLFQRGKEFSIALSGPRGELMNSRAHGSEQALAERGCAAIAGQAGARVLVGGLGMGYTLAAALRQLRADAQVDVVELLPAVVTWNRGPLADLAGQPLQDPRTRVVEADVAEVLVAADQVYDAILLDVDNGPEGLTHGDNDRLYGDTGLRAAWRALRPGGVFALWSVAPDRGFSRRLAGVGFVSKELRVRAHRGRNAPYHSIWLARRQGA